MSNPIIFTAPPGTPWPNIVDVDDNGRLHLFSLNEDGVTEWNRAARLIVCPACRDGQHAACPGYAKDHEKDIVVVCQCPHSDK